jgi:hypothetical protein
MTTYFLDTGALQRLAQGAPTQGGALDLLFSGGNSVYVTSTVVDELKIGAARGYASAQKALDWIDQNKSGPNLTEIPTPEAPGSNGGELSIKNYLTAVGGSNYNNSDFKVISEDSPALADIASTVGANHTGTILGFLSNGVLGGRSRTTKPSARSIISSTTPRRIPPIDCLSWIHRGRKTRMP